MGQRFGTEGEGVILALRGRTVSTANRGRVWTYEPIKKHLILSSDHLEPRFMPEYVAALKRWRPRHIHAFPSALFPLLVWLHEHGQQALLSQVTSVVLTSESVFEHHMRAFRAFFDCPVLVTYGHTERVLLANTLADDGRYHFWPHYGYLELLDADGRQVTQVGAVGEIVGTSFDNHVMPFVRYRTGDFAVLGGPANPRAPGFPVLERIDGRLQEFVVCADHRLVTVTTLGAAHFEQLDSCLRIQYEQHTPGELVLRVIALRPLDARAVREIEQAVRDKTQGGCRVSVQQVDDIPLTERGKQRLLVQHLDVSRYLGAAMELAERYTSRAASQPVLAGTAGSAPERLHFEGGRSVLMLGTDTVTRGGIAAVIKTYVSGGLFERVPVIHVATHQDGSRSQKAGRFLQAVGRSFMAMASGRVALVHAHVSSRASFWRKSALLTMARLLGIPTMFHLHSGGFADWCAEPGRFAGLRRWWIRRTLERSDRVIVLTRRWERWMHEFAPLSRVVVVGNPVEVPDELPPDSGRGASQGAGRVLFLGWIYDFKGVYDLLEAWVLFRQRCPGWRLVVGGKGEVDEFLAAAERLGVSPDLEFLGWVGGEEKIRQLHRADIVVLPSYSEGMPVSVLEGMAYGAAVATTPVGGVPDMMEEGVHGLWMKPGDIGGIADTLAQLASSPELRQRLSAAAYAHVLANNSVRASLEPLLATYAALAGGPRAAE
jgi:glycosyltransferase involved in cell wall biosynthesis/phenylacetate-coenzyme A ligase PaaK-like adenylate-forming protein